ncbi:MAG: class C sortase [Oscillospiraceae bacterium]|nr:class C sortase [Oscillospiraceae bacterium]
MKGKMTNILLILILIAGLSLLIYPSFSDYWNSFTQSKVIVDYTQQIENLDAEKYDRIISEAVAYNESLIGRRNPYLLSDEQKKEYYELLDITGIGIMGYIEIPAISVTIPIYHGTSDAVLQIAVGHLDWTSLPVGGESTHCVLSGHRGLPSARLFTDLDKLVVGDIFALRILDEVLTYEVDQILIVEPDETDELLIEEGKDHCTLVTCTPYGINTHRILLRGHRVENVEEAKIIKVTSEAAQIEPLIIAPIVAAPILLVLFIMLMMPKKKTNNGGDDHENQ